MSRAIALTRGCSAVACPRPDLLQPPGGLRCAAPAAEGATSGDGSIVVANNDSTAPSLREALRWLLPRYRQQSGRAGLTLDQFARLLGLDPARLDDPAPPPAGNSTGSTTTGDAGSLLLLLPTTFYDDAGNMVVNPHDTTRTYVYDAWNRMVWAEMSGLTGTEMVASDEYDGRGFRIEQSVPGKSAPVVTHDDHNDAWQVIEQRVGSSTTARAQFVWSAGYVDALVQEQRDTDANGSLDRTLYATHDANFNVTAAVTLGGIAQQRFLYDAYGARSVLTFDWQPTAAAPILEHGHQGGRSDAATGFILFRHRYLSPGLMRWTTRDPLLDAYQDGMSLYQYVGGSPGKWVDPTGESKRKPSQPGGRTYPPPLFGGEGWVWGRNPQNSRQGQWHHRESGWTASWDHVNKHWDANPPGSPRIRFDVRGNKLADGHLPPHRGRSVEPLDPKRLALGSLALGALGNALLASGASLDGFICSKNCRAWFIEANRNSHAARAGCYVNPDSVMSDNYTRCLGELPNIIADAGGESAMVLMTVDGYQQLASDLRDALIEMNAANGY